MLFLLSPAKSLDFDPAPGAPPVTGPRLADDIAVLSKTAALKQPGKLKALMGISDDLARLNAERFKAFSMTPSPEAVKPAILAFNGEVYRGLQARELDGDALAWAQDHIRILSGLYGVLRPLDALQPYRLEMGTRLKTRRGETLYAFWGNKLSKLLNQDLTDQGAEPVVINLASGEYAKAVDRKALKARVIDCEFKEVKDGQARILGVFAKKARGLMARYAIDNRVTDPEQLKAFDTEGYRFDPAASTDQTWVFSRPQP